MTLSSRIGCLGACLTLSIFLFADANRDALAFRLTEEKPSAFVQLPASAPEGDIKPTNQQPASQPPQLLVPLAATPAIPPVEAPAPQPKMVTDINSQPAAGIVPPVAPMVIAPPTIAPMVQEVPPIAPPMPDLLQQNVQSSVQSNVQQNQINTQGSPMTTPPQPIIQPITQPVAQPAAAPSMMQPIAPPVAPPITPVIPQPQLQPPPQPIRPDMSLPQMFDGRTQPPSGDPMRSQELQMGRPAVRNNQPEKVGPGAGKEGRFVTIDFQDVDLLAFIKFISEITGENFIIDNKVAGKVTIVSPTKITVEEAYQVFLSVLEVQGFATVPSGSVTKVVPAATARSKNIETSLMEESPKAEDKIVTRIIRLDYADPDEIRKLFTPLISKNSVIVSYTPTGMLIVTDLLSNIKRMMNILRVIDVAGIGEELSIIPLEHAVAKDVVRTLTTIFQSKGKMAAAAAATGKRQPGVSGSLEIKIVSDDRTNSLIVSASEHDTKKIKELIVLLDRETPRGRGDIRVYYMQYADATELAKTLTALPSKGSDMAGQKVPGPAISKETKIMADKATNAIIITASEEDYLTIIDVIKQLDIPRPMVYIEALIMEVKTGRDFNLGVEWSAGDDLGTFQGRKVVGAMGSTSGKPIISTDAAGIVSLPAGFSMGVFGDVISLGKAQFASLGALAKALRTNSDVNILQTPQLLTTDNETAEIKVGENRPYLTKAAAGDQQYQTYEYKDVGVTLKITPQINHDGLVRLKIFQEYITLAGGQVDVDKPITLKRTADTTVMVANNQTVVIGGLVGDEISRGTTAVPCLGDIPLFGWLFKSYSSSQNKTNLFIFIRPHVVQTEADAREIYQEKTEDMEELEEGVVHMYRKLLPGIDESSINRDLNGALTNGEAREAGKMEQETQPSIKTNGKKGIKQIKDADKEKTPVAPAPEQESSKALSKEIVVPESDNITPTPTPAPAPAPQTPLAPAPDAAGTTQVPQIQPAPTIPGTFIPGTFIPGTQVQPPQVPQAQPVPQELINQAPAQQAPPVMAPGVVTGGGSNNNSENDTDDGSAGD